MDDFERRRELRRQKREEMRLEAERLSYQRNDDDDEEAARERRRRARQERLRQKEEGDLSGEVTEKSEVNAQNSVAGEESKRSTDDEAALLERLARREERRQKRLQEALERQKEFDPTITDGSLSLPSRREVNNVEENETTGKEEKAETRGGHCETEETETVTKSYQRNNWRQDGEEQKKEEKDKEEVQEDKTKEVPVEENQIDVTAEKPTDKEGVETKSLVTNAEEHKAENDTNVPEGTASLTDTVDKEKLRDEDKAEEERKEAEERERLKAEEEKRAAEEKQKAEEEKRAAEERAKAEEEKRAAEERAKAEEEKRAAEERAKAEEEKRAAEERAKAEEEKRAAEERARLEAEKLKEKQKMEEQKIQDKQVKDKKAQEEKPQAVRKQEEEKEVRAEAKREKLPEEKLQPTSRKDQVKDDKDKGKAPKEEMKSVWDQKRGVPEQKAQNGERELTAPKLKPTENAFGRSNLRGAAEESKPEALKRLEDQRRRRGENDSEELEKLKEKQQEAAAELDELKKRREERRKILEEEEQKKKQEEAERKVREEEEKKRMKEEIERRRAEAAEKRQKMPEDGVSEDKKPFKCFSPKGSSLKIEERTEFLNKSAQKSGMKPTQTTAVVSKIDSRLEQYTSAIEGTKASRPAKPAASDLHVPAEGVRNIKSMWEKGNFSSPSGTGTPNKETAGLKVGVSSRINEWLTKTPESNKSPAPKPSDLKPGDVSGKRNLWEKQSVEKPPSSSSKVSAMGKKSEANAGLRQLEKEP
ncbi:caldesmon isoform X4 [Manacus candei]|uniref:caldesmon isoform X4 n=1 Tax=Manacus candei TaxID=415023 RepID=UPI00222732AD|nr:caldesmon isoform X4 [Manacus candei]